MRRQEAVNITREYLLRAKPKEVIPLEQITDELKVGVEVVSAAIAGLIREGHGFILSNQGILRTNTPETSSTYRDRHHGHDFHFGIVSDTHLASTKERLDCLNKMYDIFRREGIQAVYHAGDISEGWGVYRGQEFEVKLPGQDQQIDYIIKNYPKRRGITTYFITGNHDLRQYERGGVDIGRPIANKRRDMVYLGPTNATVQMIDGVTLELLHPSGNVAYALSYKAQRDINNRPPNNLPDILVYGHYHTSFYMHYRGIEFIQAPCFKDQGLWEKSLGLNPTIGGWIVDGHISGGNVDKFKPNLFTFNGRKK